MICPAELDQDRPHKPTPATDAKLTMNDAGAAYLKALNGWGDGLALTFDAAKKACPTTAAGVSDAPH